MAKIKRPAMSPLWEQHAKLQNEVRERGDCTVRAVAATTGRDYREVHRLFAAQGRKHGRSSNWATIRSVIDALGFKLTQISSGDFIKQYPAPHWKLRSITSHHMDRFNDVWSDGSNYILDCRSHVIGVVDGVNCDWSRGRTLRVLHVLRVEPK
jgi:hypothetical protein